MTTRDEILAVAEGVDLGPGPVALAVDVGGTGLKAALIDSSGRIVDARTAPTPTCAGTDGAEVIDAVAGLRDAFAHSTVTSAAVVVPGIVDEATGTGIHSANLGWQDAPLRALLTERLGIEVTVGHDVRAAGRAEFDLAEAMPPDAVMLTLGTGIAAAVRIDGRLVSAGGYAGEVGFTEVAVETADGLFRGPAEHIASAAAISRRYVERSGKDVTGSLAVLEAAQAGDPIAKAVLAEAVEALGAMCAQIVAVIAPQAIVFGGGLSGAAGLLDGVETAMRSRLGFHRVPSIRRARLGSAAGLIGAGLLTRDAS
ncbi:MAG: ROK family protein [Brevibacterium sp.]